MADRKHGKVDLPCGLTHGSKNDCAKVTFQISDDPFVTRGILMPGFVWYCSKCYSVCN
jgi:hypothetical protein